jgi:PhnB protein
MPRVSTYLNFAGTTEAAFDFYRQVFGTEYLMPLQRFSDIPDQPPMSDADRQGVLHVELPILAGHVLMGTDAPGSMGFTVVQGNNVHINLEPDTRDEADRLYAALSAGGSVEMPLQEMFWGGYYASFTDRFGLHWMINVRAAS